MDVYKYELKAVKTVKKAARRLIDHNVNFEILNTAIVVLAERDTRKNISNVMARIGAHTVPATCYDEMKLINRMKINGKFKQ